MNVATAGTILAAGGRPRVLLKARPTRTQLAERLAPPVPDGVELYIHEADVGGEAWFEELAARFAALAPPPGFLWIVEGPVWSLDGELFGLCRDNATDRELVHRLIRLAMHLGAGAINIHCVDGSPDVGVLDESRRDETLDRALPFLTWYAGACHDAGLVPLIENVPPICRMRRRAFIYTPIGVEVRDLLACVRAVAGLGITLDTSHAQLAVNACRGAAGPHEAEHGDLARAVAYYRAVGGAQTLGNYIAPLLPWIVGAHVSNASGVLAEGLPYHTGDADLDAAVAQLAAAARYFVTEPLDDDEDHPIHKRDMQRRLAVVLATSVTGVAR